jgi:hypothetical protein
MNCQIFRPSISDSRRRANWGLKQLDTFYLGQFGGLAIWRIVDIESYSRPAEDPQLNTEHSLNNFFYDDQTDRC